MSVRIPTTCKQHSFVCCYTQCLSKRLRILTVFRALVCMPMCLRIIGLCLRINRLATNILQKPLRITFDTLMRNHFLSRCNYKTYESHCAETYKHIPYGILQSLHAYTRNAHKGGGPPFPLLPCDAFAVCKHPHPCKSFNSNHRGDPWMLSLPG